MLGSSFADVATLTENWLPWPGIAHLNRLQMDAAIAPEDEDDGTGNT